MARDLEERVSQLEREKIRLTAMLESMQEGLLVIGEDKNILLINSAASRILGIAVERATGHSLLQIARNADLEALVDEALASNRGGSREIRFFKPEEIFLRVNAVPYRVASGERQAVLVFHDVTEIHRLENVRREFVANVSHELKTPLTSLQGFIETLLAGAWQKPEHTRRFLGMMEEDSRRLSRLIHDLLDLSRIESQERPERREPIDLGQITGRVLSGLESQIVQKKLTITNTIPIGGSKALGDPGAIEQVLVNLLENAVKFTPEGGSIEVRSKAAEGAVRVEVQDNGPGIPEGSLTRVFERFYRVDPARSREMGGTGLGLSIVKHIVDQHGGSVGVTSPGVDRGSVFFFTLPLTDLS
jgi:two-component system phosphate regulon sensor histidine kinase PhoR